MQCNPTRTTWLSQSWKISTLVRGTYVPLYYDPSPCNILIRNDSSPYNVPTGTDPSPCNILIRYV